MTPEQRRLRECEGHRHGRSVLRVQQRAPAHSPARAQRMPLAETSDHCFIPRTTTIADIRRPSTRDTALCVTVTPRPCAILWEWEQGSSVCVVFWTDSVAGHSGPAGLALWSDSCMLMLHAQASHIVAPLPALARSNHTSHAFGPIHSWPLAIRSIDAQARCVRRARHARLLRLLPSRRRRTRHGQAHVVRPPFDTRKLISRALRLNNACMLLALGLGLGRGSAGARWAASGDDNWWFTGQTGGRPSRTAVCLGRT